MLLGEVLHQRFPAIEFNLARSRDEAAQPVAVA
jgi:hypothetical protein